MQRHDPRGPRWAGKDKWLEGCSLLTLPSSATLPPVLHTQSTPSSAPSPPVPSAWDGHLLTWPAPLGSPRRAREPSLLLSTASHSGSDPGRQPGRGRRTSVSSLGLGGGTVTKITRKAAAPGPAWRPRHLPHPGPPACSRGKSKRPLQARGGWTCCQHYKATLLSVLAGRHLSNRLIKFSAFEASF